MKLIFVNQLKLINIKLTCTCEMAYKIKIQRFILACSFKSLVYIEDLQFGQKATQFKTLGTEKKT